MGTFGFILDPWILRLTTIEGVVVVCVFYLFVGVLFALTGKPLRLREIQRKVLRPVFTPFLFQIAGFFAGISVPLINKGSYLPLVLPLATILFALATHHAYELIGAKHLHTDG